MKYLSLMPTRFSSFFYSTDVKISPQFRLCGVCIQKHFIEFSKVCRHFFPGSFLPLLVFSVQALIIFSSPQFPSNPLQSPINIFGGRGNIGACMRPILPPRIPIPPKRVSPRSFFSPMEVWRLGIGWTLHLRSYLNSLVPHLFPYSHNLFFIQPRPRSLCALSGIVQPRCFHVISLVAQMAEDPATRMHVHDLEVEKLRQQKHHKRLLLFSLHTVCPTQ